MAYLPVRSLSLIRSDVAWISKTLYVNLAFGLICIQNSSKTCTFGNFRCFLAFYCLITTFQRTPGRMLGSLIQSIERQFQIPSRISGFVMSAGDISYVSTIIILAYFGSQGNRAQWIGYGGLVVAFACLIISSPGYLLSQSQDSGITKMSIEPLNATSALLQEAKLAFAYCDNNVMDLRSKLQQAKCEQNDDNLGNMAAFYIVLAGVILMDVSRSLPKTLGVPLIDDNVKDKRQTPYYFAMISAARIAGSLIGIVLIAVCSRLYVTFNAPPGMTPYDPNWIGAWWLGFAIAGAALVAPSIMMVCSAGALGTKKDHVGKEYEMEAINGDLDSSIHPPQPETKDPRGGQICAQIRSLITSIGACLRSPIYTSHLMASILLAFAWKGMFAFWSKYMENHFGIPMYQVNLIFGFLGVFGYTSGVVLGSYLMRRFNLDGRRAAAFVALGCILSTLLTVCLVFLKCHSVINRIGRDGVQHDFRYPACQDCNCTLAPLYPVCSMDGTPFYSPCHAGCTGYNNTGSLDFHGCSCVNGTRDAQRVSRDYCTDDCFAPMVAYFAIFGVTEIILGTSHVANMLIGLRSVPKEHRSTAIAFNTFAPALISALPSAPLYGMIFDAACLLWNKKPCGGKRGACLIYDPSVLRNGITIFYISLNVAADCCLLFMLYKAKKLKLMEDDEEEEKDVKPTTKSALLVASG